LKNAKQTAESILNFGSPNRRFAPVIGRNSIDFGKVTFGQSHNSFH
jgi:hypothetical protein